MKQAIISFSVALTINGQSIAEIKSKFENMNIPFEFIELLSVEDAETRDDLMEVWDNDQLLCELEDELRFEFYDFDTDTDTLCVEDFGVKHNGTIITHVTKPNEANICFWSGNPHTDKDAEEIQITDYDQRREIIIEILQYL